MQTLKTVFGDYQLQRLPLPTKNQADNLRAWDAADELILQYINEHCQPYLKQQEKPILILNDAFGALTVSLHKNRTHNGSDSYVSHLAARHNLSLNNLNDTFTTIPSTEAFQTNYDLVLIKVPKTIALLEHQLYQLKGHINQNTVIVAAAMAKHIHTSTLKYFEKIIGTTTTSRATKKARLIFAVNDNLSDHATLRNNKIESPYPKSFTNDALKLTLSNHANVFSKEHLDIGARFMIEQLKHCPTAKHIIDLGCGNGVLGIMAQRLQPIAQVSFVDESYMAVESAKMNYAENLSDLKNSPEVHFAIGNSLDQFTGNKADLILCNPPFHQAHSIDDQVAWQMFKQSREHLNPNGELWIVGNRHLAYHIKLKRLFGNCRTIASNKKFVVLAASVSF